MTIHRSKSRHDQLLMVDSCRPCAEVNLGGWLLLEPGPSVLLAAAGDSEGSDQNQWVDIMSKVDYTMYDHVSIFIILKISTHY